MSSLMFCVHVLSPWHILSTRDKLCRKVHLLHNLSLFPQQHSVSLLMCVHVPTLLQLYTYIYIYGWIDIIYTHTPEAEVNSSSTVCLALYAVHVFYS